MNVCHHIIYRPGIICEVVSTPGGCPDLFINRHVTEMPAAICLSIYLSVYTYPTDHRVATG